MVTIWLIGWLPTNDMRSHITNQSVCWLYMWEGDPQSYAPVPQQTQEEEMPRDSHVATQNMFAIENMNVVVMKICLILQTYFDDKPNPHFPIRSGNTPGEYRP